MCDCVCLYTITIPQSLNVLYLRPLLLNCLFRSWIYATSIDSISLCCATTYWVVPAFVSADCPVNPVLTGRHPRKFLMSTGSIVSFQKMIIFGWYHQLCRHSICKYQTSFPAPTAIISLDFSLQPSLICLSIRRIIPSLPLDGLWLLLAGMGCSGVYTKPAAHI